MVKFTQVLVIYVKHLHISKHWRPILPCSYFWTFAQYVEGKRGFQACIYTFWKMQKIIYFFVQSGLETYISVITERDLWRLDSLRVHCAGALAFPICAVHALLSKFHLNFIQVFIQIKLWQNRDKIGIKRVSSNKRLYKIDIKLKKLIYM